MTGSRLNNFVTELFSADLQNGDFPFENPRAGWLHLSVSKALWRVTGKLDGSTGNAITYRTPPAGEAVRSLAAGRHTLKMEGVGEVNAAGVKLRVRTIKPILADARVLTALRGGVNGLDTWRAHAVSALTCVCRPPAGDDPLAAIFEADFARRGIKIVAPEELPPSTLGPLAYREGGKWMALEPSAEAIGKLAVDPAHVAVEALAVLPDALSPEEFRRLFAAIRHYAIQGNVSAPVKK